MFQPKDPDSFESDKSVSENQDSPLPSSISPSNTQSEVFSELEISEKKSFSEKWRTNRFWIVKGAYHILRSVWVVVMFIGGFIAWLISLLFI